jgi:hypothetical protein
VGRGPATFKKEDLKRALSATKEAGFNVQRIEIDKTGNIVVVTAQSAMGAGDKGADDWANI